MTALTDYAKTTNVTPQGERAREDQVKNNAGGFVFEIGPFAALQRFLVLGTEGGTYYASQKSHTIQAVDSLKQAAKVDGIRAVNLVVEISTAGRAIKNDQAIFALAYLASVDDDKVRAYALSKLNDVCRIGTHLFQFAEYVQGFRGWGRGLRNAMANWYESKGVEQIAYQATKYGQRNGWSHRDIFRLSHPDMSHTPGTKDIAKFITHADEYVIGDHTVPIVEGYIKIRDAKNAEEAAMLIRKYNLTHDMVPTQFKVDAGVWNALLDVGIPYTALMRNLGNLSKYGVLKPLGGRNAEVVAQLTNDKRITNSRVHPFAVLVAKATYGNGVGYRGAGGWTVVPEINDALEDAYYKAFGNVVPSNKRTFIGVDCSGSMGMRMGDSPLTCFEGAAAFSMVTVRTEPQTYVRGFSSASYYGRNANPHDGLKDIGLTKKQNLDTIVRNMRGFAWGGTDCALPMLHAEALNLEVDTFVVVTDNDTWAGNIHPYQALKQYRKSSGIDAKLVVVGMTATRFSIADPKDSGMLDVVGFDTAAPQLIADFSAGRI